MHFNSCPRDHCPGIQPQLLVISQKTDIILFILTLLKCEPYLKRGSSSPNFSRELSLRWDRDRAILTTWERCPSLFGCAVSANCCISIGLNHQDNCYSITRHIQSQNRRLFSLTLQPPSFAYQKAFFLP